MPKATGSVSFDFPPVVEVLVAVAFDSVDGLGSYMAWPLLQQWSETYPQVSEQPALPPVEPLGQAPSAFIRVGPSTPNRLWFEANDGFLIQLQADRLVVNWRAGEGRVYPRYGELRSRFQQAWHDLTAAIPADQLHVRQTEVTYVNAAPHPPESVFQGWGSMPIMAQAAGLQAISTRTPVKLSGVAAAVRHTGVQGELGESARTTLTLSVLAEVGTATEVQPTADASRWHIVERFRDITTIQMHELWGCQCDDHDR